uniref:Alanine--tRNA ligase n=1 Tax=Tetraselmis sp. GSL018 TaxID=582737 RepID=A0A061SAZ8_9CHLO|eukprot:CAMPEP_0177587966 /NCGR_PEP_ID=MMETSP0419_2-20121207/5958_1 /TAXON_ID=582737 /ORGANISM="Tetraselmis sp., Strain GSL018" /LENGTH=1170 /DNA_ID=CAMNT_0019078101 /DNA_START=71 /DNA_END=3583 /DNA_ORIENTATION=-
MTSSKLWGTGPSAMTVEAVAFACKVDIETPFFCAGVTNKTPQYISQISPEGVAPALETGKGVVTGTVQILEEIISSAGKEDVAAMRAVLSWAGAAATLADEWVPPLMGQCPQGEGADALPQRLVRLLGELEGMTEGRDWLLGAGPSAADFVAAAAFFPLYVLVADAAALGASPRAADLLARVYDLPEMRECYGCKAVPPAQRAASAEAAARVLGEGSGWSQQVERALSRKWSAGLVRQTYIDFFACKEHTFWPSSSVVPHNDPTLLFTNAGMNQYKPIFLGTADPAADLSKLKRAANSQKCIRAGGKHNDLDDVGKDVYHHTFFEMLGNWSFGDYFKREAIGYAWELLTEVFKMDPGRLYATYFGGDEKLGLPPDLEAKQIWTEYLPESRVLPFDCKDNFWEMGDQGPCGPCTEIHYDRIGGRDAAHLVNMDDPDVLEIWNVVFIQFNREADGSLKPLPEKHVDTGMGMERVVSVLQNKRSNYATDVFTPIFEAIQKVSGARPYTDKVGPEDSDGKDMAYRVVADHIRTLSFAIADGARPGNVGRDYVLRRILRRAVRYGTEVLGAKEGFFAELVDVVAEHMGKFFPELISARETIRSVLVEEETSFGRTLKKGIERFRNMVDGLSGKVFSGTDAFQLWDTYGFPVDLTELMAEEKGLTVDMQGFEAAMEAARQLSREGGKSDSGLKLKIAAEETAWLINAGIAPTDDKPKYVEEDVDATVMAILSVSGFVDTTNVPEGLVGLVLDKTSFYAEAGGQVADTGAIEAAGAAFQVSGATVARGFVFHTGVATSGEIKVGDRVKTRVDYERRHLTMPNHTMTHALNFALRKVLGPTIDQKGSLVNPEYLRFDFNNNSAVSPEDIGRIEAIVSDLIEAKIPVYAKDVAKADALAINGLRAVFGEDYPDPVRVLSIGVSVDELVADPSKPTHVEHSIEFCGGTHLTNTSQAKCFAIISEEGIAKGIRRIVAYTGDAAAKAISEGEAFSAKLTSAESLDGPALETEIVNLKAALDTAVIPAFKKSELRKRVAKLVSKLTEMKKVLAAENIKKATGAAVAVADEAASQGEAYVVAKVDVGLDPKAVMEACNAVQKKHGDMAVMLLSSDPNKEKALAYAGVPKDLTQKLAAGDWVKSALDVLGGKGGGKPTNAQGQGPNWQKVDEAMKAAQELARMKL